MNNREKIYDALLSLSYKVTSAKTRSRKLKIYSDVPPSECPSIFQNQTGETVTQTARGIPAIRTLKVDWYVYLNDNGDRNTPPSVALNNILTEIDLALVADATTGVNTLGGIVSHCWIEGEVRIVEALLNDYTIAIIPIHIKTSEVI
jgi:hypothetical protein